MLWWRSSEISHQWCFYIFQGYYKLWRASASRPLLRTNSELARSVLFDREIRIHLGVDNIWSSTLHVGIRKSSGSFFKISMHSCARIERDIIIYEDDIVTFQFWAIYEGRGLYIETCATCVKFRLALLTKVSVRWCNHYILIKASCTDWDGERLQIWTTCNLSMTIVRKCLNHCGVTSTIRWWVRVGILCITCNLLTTSEML